MIRKWVLNNFKSVSREVPLELEFRPLTIFSGANSSGKSTILQSILLVAQTLQSQNASKAVVLNGHIKKFGTYEDIVNMRDDMKDITIGFELQNDDIPVVPKKKASIKNDVDVVDKIDCSIEIATDMMPDCVMPLMQRFYAKTFFVDGKEGVCDVVREEFSRKSDKEQEAIVALGGAVSSEYFDYKIKRFEGPVSIVNPTAFESGNVLGLGLKHFFPSSVVLVNSLRNMAKDYLASIIIRNGYHNVSINGDERKKISRAVQATCIEIAESLLASDKRTSLPLEYVSREVTKIKKRFSLGTFSNLLFWYCQDDKERMKYVELLYKCIDSMKDQINVSIAGINMEGTNMVGRFFNSNIKYLAPLREEPRALYPIDSNGDMTDVGLKGENTAAVYQNNKSKDVVYVPSSAFANSNFDASTAKKATLSEAITDWLAYLGVAEEINTNEQGKFGHELKIHTENGLDQDLTHVGVGVSQVLPILVMAFLAKKGDVIILEQPELHLHPKVQTRLADFFVSMNALGKQCLIETHSEYMINRLRYHVAVAEDSKVADDTMIYFVEKDKATGNSNYRPVTINRYGVIEDWPEGFFDESERIARDILEAGMAKKMKETDDYEE